MDKYMKMPRLWTQDRKLVTGLATVRGRDTPLCDMWVCTGLTFESSRGAVRAPDPSEIKLGRGWWDAISRGQIGRAHV